MAKKSKQQDLKGAELRGVDLNEVERLLAFMKKHGLEEFEYQRGDVHIRLRKASSAPVAAGWVPATGSPAPHAEAAAATPQAAGPAPAAEEASDAGLHVIKSPIVGTFYAAPGPDAPPFASPGARVEAGQVLCIVEAMKLMNEIESDVAGELVKVFVENGEPVEYGQPLFGVRPNGRK
jgi:acetyl-CoA carboxylase biotin carboxyl carrier protein